MFKKFTEFKELRATDILNEGYQAYVEGNNSKALSLFKKAVSLDGENSDAQYYCACAFETLNMHVLAEPYYERCLSLEEKQHGQNSPGYARALHNLGTNAAWLQRNTRSLELAKQAMTVVDGKMVRPPSVSDDKWHIDVGRAEKLLAIIEAHLRLGEPLAAAESVACFADAVFRPSDEGVLLRLIFSLEQSNSMRFIEWQSRSITCVLEAILGFSELGVEVGLIDFLQEHTRPRALEMLLQRRSALQVGVNPRLMQ